MESEDNCWDACDRAFDSWLCSKDAARKEKASQPTITSRTRRRTHNNFTNSILYDLGLRGIKWGRNQIEDRSWHTRRLSWQGRMTVLIWNCEKKERTTVIQTYNNMCYSEHVVPARKCRISDYVGFSWAFCNSASLKNLARHRKWNKKSHCTMTVSFFLTSWKI